MAAIHSLLNPMPEPSETQTFQLPSPSPSAHTVDSSPPNYPRKKQKLCKDAAVFIKGNIRGQCRYPAIEDRDGIFKAYHRAHNVHPLGTIMEFPRHVPYNSEKKSFLEKTGRDCFEVFQYEFQAWGEEKVYTMMWDYNIGLVRTTPLFKCMGYSKTTPAKMLNRNPGLREICHSITGGALVAQGYWMPFEAAKAVAATFCWRIRHALTPVFGPDFPPMCLQPESEGFGTMVIDPAITQRCTEEASLYRKLENDAPSGRRSPLRSPLTPDSPAMPKHIKRLRPKNRRLVESPRGYYSDSSNPEDNSTSTSVSPTLMYCNTWTATNIPRSVASAVNERLPSSKEFLAGISGQAAEVDVTDEAGNQSDDSSTTSSTTSLLLKSRQGSNDEEGEFADAEENSHETPVATTPREAAQRHGAAIHPISDEKAACLLVQLSMEARAAKRRASA